MKYFVLLIGLLVIGTPVFADEANQQKQKEKIVLEKRKEEPARSPPNKIHIPFDNSGRVDPGMQFLLELYIHILRN